VPERPVRPDRTSTGLRRRRTWDVVLAIALAVVLVVLAAVLGLAGAFLVMASDSCGTTVACRTGQLSAGVFVAMLGPAVVAVVAIVSVVERLVRGRLAFWPPLVGAVVAVLVWSGGVALVFTSVPSS
jgi:uncharacterized BrkB/YihY/UPF0761 family membrane protein